MVSNMSEQLLKEVKHETVITASGAGMDETVSSIFQKMRKQIFSEFGNPIIHMEAIEVYFEKVEVDEKKETFLFIFMPRIRKYFTVTARIVLAVKYLDVKKGTV